MDWGFTRFLDLQKLAQPWEGHDSLLIDNDEVNITVYIRVVEDPTGVLWHNFLK
jgi:ubiquitin carboxyl-terminal hydrolase 7